MTITIRLPEALRELAGISEVALLAATVGEALDRLTERYPAMRPHIFDERAQVRGFVNTFINDTDSRSLGGVSARLESGDTLTIVPSIAGG